MERKFRLRILLGILLLILTFNLPNILTFSIKRDKVLLEVFNRNLNLIGQFCKKGEYRYPFFTSITFGNMPDGDVVAYCHRKANGFSLVFDKRYWGILSEVDRNQLMMHEMAHCMFNERHSTNPKHFMSASMNELTEQELNVQVYDFLNKKCGGEK